METIKKLMNLSSKKHPGVSPHLIIKNEASDTNIKEFKSIEEAIVDLENDPNVPVHKIEKLKISLKNLKNKTSIKIRNGEII